MSRLLILAGLFLLLLPLWLVSGPNPVLDLQPAWEFALPETETQGEVIPSRGPPSRASLSRGSTADRRSEWRDISTQADQDPSRAWRAVGLEVLDQGSDEPITELSYRIFSIQGPDYPLFHQERIRGKRSFRLAIPNGPLDNWVLELRAPGHRQCQWRLSEFLDEDLLEQRYEDQTECDTVYLERGHSLRGRILDQAGRPVAGADVQADPGDEGWTDPQGEYALMMHEPDDEVESMIVRAEKEDVGSVEQEVWLSGSRDQRLPDLRLGGNGILTARFQLEDGTPLRGFQVDVERIEPDDEEEAPQGIDWMRTHTDEHGRIHLKGMAPGDYVVDVALADLSGRELETKATMSMRGVIQTGSPERFYRLVCVDIEVQCAQRSAAHTIEGWFSEPGSDRCHSFEWPASSMHESRSLPMQPGSRVWLSSEVPGVVWAEGRVRVKPAPVRQALVLHMPDPAHWVRVSLEVAAPRLMANKKAGILIMRKGEWCERALEEVSTGVFEFLVPPGPQQVLCMLVHRKSYCIPCAIRPKARPEWMPLDARMDETRELLAAGGGKVHLRWVPQKLAGLTYRFEVKGVGRPVQQHQREAKKKRASRIPKIRVTQWGPKWTTPKRAGHTDVELGDHLSFGHALRTGRHRLRFEAKGFATIERHVWLQAGQDRLITVELEPTPMPSPVNPYTCGRAKR